MNICLFSRDEINKPLSITDERGRHIIKILHKKEGDSFSAGIINGRAGIATIKNISDGQIHFSFAETSEGKSLYPLKMIIGFPRPIQLKRLLRDMAALGVCEVHLTATELGEKSYLDSSLATSDSGNQMLLDGTIQAASTHVPELFIHKSLKETIDAIKTTESKNFFALDNIEPQGSLSQHLAKLSTEGMTFDCAVAAIGSERGWTGNERQLLKDEGFILLGMGQRVMRTETAATVAASLILGSMGKLN